MAPWICIGHEFGPLEIDLLVIKKDNIDTFYKSGAYASLYKSYGENVDIRTADDITVSIVRQSRPVGLFGYFEKHGIRVTNPYHGIWKLFLKGLTV